MIRVSRMADYGLVVLSQLAREQGRHLTAAEIATATQLPSPTVSKLLKQFAHVDILVSHRGARGGYSMERSPADISVAEIIRVVDGPIALADCLDGSEGCCQIESFCPIRGPWQNVSNAIERALADVSLAQMTCLPSFELPARDLPRDAAPLELMG
jgi:FeS assembly SUF system regulator